MTYKLFGILRQCTRSASSQRRHNRKNKLNVDAQSFCASKQKCKHMTARYAYLTGNHQFSITHRQHRKISPSTALLVCPTIPDTQMRSGTCAHLAMDANKQVHTPPWCKDDHKRAITAEKAAAAGTYLPLHDRPAAVDRFAPTDPAARPMQCACPRVSSLPPALLPLLPRSAAPHCYCWPNMLLQQHKPETSLHQIAHHPCSQDRRAAAGGGTR